MERKSGPMFMGSSDERGLAREEGCHSFLPTTLLPSGPQGQWMDNEQSLGYLPKVTQVYWYNALRVKTNQKTLSSLSQINADPKFHVLPYYMSFRFLRGKAQSPRTPQLIAWTLGCSPGIRPYSTLTTVMFAQNDAINYSDPQSCRFHTVLWAQDIRPASPLSRLVHQEVSPNIRVQMVLL